MKIEFIAGCMKSGKSLCLINKIKEQKLPYMILKPSIDTRNGEFITSRGSEETYPALMVDEKDVRQTAEIFTKIRFANTIYVDEVQFFSPAFIYRLIEDCKYFNTNLVSSGLLLDFKDEFFPTSEMLMNVADTFSLLAGSCDDCGNLGGHDIKIDTHTMNKISHGDSVMIEGTSDRYIFKTVCSTCYHEIWK